MSGWIGAWGNSATVTNLTVTGSQLISVNTSTDAFRITQTGSGNALVVEDSANPDATPFVVNADGRVGIGTTPSSGRLLSFGSTVSGSSGYSTGIYSQIASDPATTTYQMASFASVPTISPSSLFPELVHYWTYQNAFGAGATVTNQYGFQTTNSITGATNNYGFYSAIPSGSGRYNFYAAGTADNFFAGNTYAASGTTTMTNGFFYIPSAAGAPSGVPTAVSGRVPMYYDTTNNNFYVYNGAWKKVLLA